MGTDKYRRHHHHMLLLLPLPNTPPPLPTPAHCTLPHRPGHAVMNVGLTTSIRPAHWEKMPARTSMSARLVAKDTYWLMTGVSTRETREMIVTAGQSASLGTSIMTRQEGLRGPTTSISRRRRLSTLADHQRRCSRCNADRQEKIDLI